MRTIAMSHGSKLGKGESKKRPSEKLGKRGDATLKGLRCKKRIGKGEHPIPLLSRQREGAPGGERATTPTQG